MKHLVLLLLATVLVSAAPAPAQTAQVGADRAARGSSKLQVEYLHYRPAVWEKEQVVEFENEHPNEGGLIYVYLRNVTEEPINLRFWRANEQDESYWRLNHFIAWDRAYDRTVAPGQLTVFEINATSADFAAGKDFALAWVGGEWQPVGTYKTTLAKDPVQIGFVRVLPGLQTLEVHVRNEGDAALTLTKLAVEGAPGKAAWTTTALAPGGHAIGTLQLAAPLAQMQLTIVQLGVAAEDGNERTVMAHRRAFADYFPIGIWTNNETLWPKWASMHIDTMVHGGSPEDDFWQRAVPEYGFKGMVHSGVPVEVDRVRALRDTPGVACWMLQDEPDWSIPPNIMLHVNEATRREGPNVPTFITLCRNIKFFEYAPICDIPCMDHYAVTAPSSSKWPKYYGTRLEETAWYTRDLKWASEPKPIWIWTQGIADWDERPKRPVPTVEEMAAQLVLNLGRGAKGILWFNWDDDRAEKYPEMPEAMRGWGRVMAALKEDFLATDVAALPVEAPAKLDVAPLVGKDLVLLCLTNTDYEIHPEAYPFTPIENATLKVTLPSWIAPKHAYALTPAGLQDIAFTAEGTVATFADFTLPVTTIIAITGDDAVRARHEASYAATAPPADAAPAAAQ